MWSLHSGRRFSARSVEVTRIEIIEGTIYDSAAGEVFLHHFLYGCLST